MMKAEGFIAQKIRFKGRLSAVAIAISFFVIIIAVAISGGFRHEIRKGVASITGDIVLTSPSTGYYGEDNPISATPSYMDRLLEVKGVESISPAVYRAGIVRSCSDIHGVMIKGTPDYADTTTLGVSVPRRLADLLRLKEGDPMLTYFVGERVKVRKFIVSSIYDSLIDYDETLIVHARMSDLQRLNGWDSDRVSILEVGLDDRRRSDAEIRGISHEIGGISLNCAGEDEDVLVATAAVDRYSTLFDWLNLIDFNVGAILILMTIVAGFNMISGLLILLFRNISTIGTLKALGMTDKGIAGVFLRVSSRIVLIGMAAGNALALLFCLIQGSTHLIRLNPENYFVSFVPVKVDLLSVLAADAAAFAAIMLLLLIPSMFISKIDPSETVKSE